MTSSPRPPTFYAFCRLIAGDDNQVRGGGNGVIPASMMVIHEFAAAGTAEIRCSDSSNEASTWAKARITAVQVMSAGQVAGPPGVVDPPGNVLQP